MPKRSLPTLETIIFKLETSIQNLAAVKHHLGFIPELDTVRNRVGNIQRRLESELMDAKKERREAAKKQPK